VKEAILMLILAAVSVFGIIGWLLFLVKCSTSKWDYLDLGRQLEEMRAKLAETEAALGEAKAHLAVFGSRYIEPLYAKPCFGDGIGNGPLGEPLFHHFCQTYNTQTGETKGVYLRDAEGCLRVFDADGNDAAPPPYGRKGFLDDTAPIRFRKNEEVT
jgi:hypothetical protein